MLSSTSHLLVGAILLGITSITLAATGAPNVNSYIFHLNSGVNVNTYLTALQRNLTAANSKAKITTNVLYSNVTIAHTFVGGHLFLTPSQFAIEAKDPRVSDMSAEIIGGTADTGWAPCTSDKPECSAKVPWGLASLTLPAGKKVSTTNTTGRTYNPPAGFTGQGATIYLIDTGVVPNATEYGTRLITGPSVYPGFANVDDNGHGTAMASIIGSKMFGVAKQTTIFSVKAFNAYAQTYSPILLQALKVVWADMNSKPGSAKRSVINLSGYLTERDATIDAAVLSFYGDFGSLNSYYDNVIFRAAGNVIGGDACQFSPLSLQTTQVVMGHDETNAIVSYNAEISYYTAVHSNPRPSSSECSGIVAPGIHIVGWGPDYTKYIGYGSSMATAFVSGYVAGIIGFPGLVHDRTMYDFTIVPSYAIRMFGRRDVAEGAFARLSIPPTAAYITDIYNQTQSPGSYLYGYCLENPTAPPTSCNFCNGGTSLPCNFFPE